MGPLEGVRVLDHTIFQWGPQASLVFADMGAKVVTVEAPAFGDLGQVMDLTRNDRFSPTPELGHQTEEILQELDCSWEQSEGLRERGVLG